MEVQIEDSWKEVLKQEFSKNYFIQIVNHIKTEKLTNAVIYPKGSLIFNAFTQTPHVVITPVGSNCAGLNYYVNRTTGGFSIGTTNSANPGTGCAFDYIAID